MNESLMYGSEDEYKAVTLMLSSTFQACGENVRLISACTEKHSSVKQELNVERVSLTGECQLLILATEAIAISKAPVQRACDF